MKIKLKIFLIAVSAISLVSGYSFGAIVPITSITATGSSGPNPINLTSITVSSYTIGVSSLVTGTGSGTYTGGGTPAFPVANADNFNINSFASLYNPHDIVLFGGLNWFDTNGNNPDFFIFENGGLDTGTIRAIFPNGTFGNTISFNGSSHWGDTGFNSSVGDQDIKGLAFSITDLLDASGANLTNSSVIKGIRIASTGLDPSSISAVATPIPAAAWLLGTGLVGLIAIKRRRRS